MLMLLSQSLWFRLYLLQCFGCCIQIFFMQVSCCCCLHLVRCSAAVAFRSGQGSWCGLVSGCYCPSLFVAACFWSSAKLLFCPSCFGSAASLAVPLVVAVRSTSFRHLTVAACSSLLLFRQLLPSAAVWFCCPRSSAPAVNCLWLLVSGAHFQSKYCLVMSGRYGSLFLSMPACPECGTQSVLFLWVTPVGLFIAHMDVGCAVASHCPAVVAFKSTWSRPFGVSCLRQLKSLSFWSPADCCPIGEITFN